MTSNQKQLLRLAALVLGCLAASGLAFGQTPAIFANGTVNAADYSRSFAPGGIISIFGTNLAASAQPAAQIPLPTSLGGALVLVNGVAAPLLYVSAGQINAQLPYGATGSYQIQVNTAAGTSAADTITVSTRAPKIFSINFSGQGPVVATNSSSVVLTSTNAAAPAQIVSVYMNSLGATTGNPVAGQASPQNANVSDTVTATIGGAAAQVLVAGLQPGSTGLYRVDIQVPFVPLAGPISITVTVGGVSAQANTTVWYRTLGYYYALSGGKSVAGQTANGVSGANSALAFRQQDQGTWGATGFNAWTTNTGLGSLYSATKGLGLTLMNGTSIVYDNNGIENGTAGTYYDNRGGGADSTKPGLSDYYSNSNYYPLVFAGYFSLAAPTTITQLIGYFDAGANATLPFDPANPYVKYRMNIWKGLSSPITGFIPQDTGNFVGNILSTDTVAGTFSYSKTNVSMFSSSNASKPIYRLAYTLAAPIVLPAGDYWLAHDAAVRQQPAASSTSAFPIVTSSELMRFTNSLRGRQIGQDGGGWVVPDVSSTSAYPVITSNELMRLTSSQQGRPLRQPVRFSLLGMDMVIEDGGGWAVPDAPVTVRPGSPVEQH